MTPVSDVFMSENECFYNRQSIPGDFYAADLEYNVLDSGVVFQESFTCMVPRMDALAFGDETGMR